MLVSAAWLLPAVFYRRLSVLAGFSCAVFADPLHAPASANKPQKYNKDTGMSETIRFGVSLNADLLEKFDTLCASQGYKNRSESIRDLIRKALVQEEWHDDSAIVAATLTLVYDHHRSDLAQKIMEIQHDAHHLIITTLHVHLDHDNCLEVLVLRGTNAEVRALGESLIATKGIVFGNLSLATTGKNIC